MLSITCFSFICKACRWFSGNITVRNILCSDANLEIPFRSFVSHCLHLADIMHYIALCYFFKLCLNILAIASLNTSLKPLKYTFDQQMFYLSIYNSRMRSCLATPGVFRAVLIVQLSDTDRLIACTRSFISICCFMNNLFQFL